MSEEKNEPEENIVEVEEPIEEESFTKIEDEPQEELIDDDKIVMPPFRNNINKLVFILLGICIFIILVMMSFKF